MRVLREHPSGSPVRLSLNRYEALRNAVLVIWEGAGELIGASRRTRYNEGYHGHIDYSFSDRAWIDTEETKADTVSAHTTDRPGAIHCRLCQFVCSSHLVPLVLRIYFN